MCSLFLSGLEMMLVLKMLMFGLNGNVVSVLMFFVLLKSISFFSLFVCMCVKVSGLL